MGTSINFKINPTDAILKKQEAMENFIFPNEITTKLMKIEKKGKLTKHEMGEKKRFEKKLFLKGAHFSSNPALLEISLKPQENVTTLNSNSKQTAGRINLKPI